MTSDELEFLISQQLDGTLDAAERVKLDHALATNAQARALLAEHEALDQALKASRKVVDVDEEWLVAQVAAKIDESNAQTIKISHWMWSAPVAAAAMLMIGLTLGVIFLRDDGVPEGQVATKTVKTIELNGTPNTTALAMKPATPAVANVSVGVPANLTAAMLTSLYLTDGSASGRVTIRPAGHSTYNAFE